MSRHQRTLGLVLASSTCAAALLAITATPAAAQSTNTCTSQVAYITIHGQPYEVGCDNVPRPVLNAPAQQPQQPPPPSGEVRQDFRDPPPPANTGQVADNTDDPQPTVQYALITVDTTDGHWRTPETGEYNMRQVTFQQYAASPGNGGQQGWNTLRGEYADSCREVGWQAGEAAAVILEAQRIGHNIDIRQAEIEAMFGDITHTSWGRRFLSALGGGFLCAAGLAGGGPTGIPYCLGSLSGIAGGELTSTSGDNQRRLDLRTRVDDVETRELDLRTRVLDGRMRISWTTAMLRRGGCLTNQAGAVRAGFSEVRPFHATRVNFTPQNQRGHGRNQPAAQTAQPDPNDHSRDWLTWSPYGQQPAQPAQQ